MMQIDNNMGKDELSNVEYHDLPSAILQIERDTDALNLKVSEMQSQGLISEQ